jgi:hypothetical protein
MNVPYQSGSHRAVDRPARFPAVPDGFHGGHDGRVTLGRFYEIRLTGWRRVVYRIVSVATVSNVLSWFDCSVPGTRGRLRKLWEPWRWRQGKSRS